MFFDDYLKATLMWPQKRGAISIYMLNTLTNDYGLNTWREINCYSLSKEEIERVEKIMNRAHKQIGVTRKLDTTDILKDWTLTLGAIYRSLIILIKNEDPINGVTSYSDLITDEYYHLISKKITEMSTQNNHRDWRICQHAKYILEQNTPLAYLFRAGFNKSNKILPENKRLLYQSIISSYSKENNYESYTPNKIWNLLGDILNNQLKEIYPDANIKWLVWGFTL